MKVHSNKLFSTLVSWIAFSGRRIKELHGDHQQRKIQHLLNQPLSSMWTLPVHPIFSLASPGEHMAGVREWCKQNHSCSKRLSNCPAKRNTRWLCRDKLQCNMSSLIQLLSMKTCSIFKFLRQIYFNVMKYHFTSSFVPSWNSIYTFTNVSFSLMTLLLLKIKRVKMKFTLL